MADVVAREVRAPAARPRTSTRWLAQRKSMVAFLFALPLILVIVCLVVYPALYAVNLATLNKSMQHHVWFGNFTFLFKRTTFWMVVEQWVRFAVTAVVSRPVIGFFLVILLHTIPLRVRPNCR